MHLANHDYPWHRRLLSAPVERLKPMHVMTAVTIWVVIFSAIGVHWSLPTTERNQYFAACDLSLVASSVAGTYSYPVMPWFSRHPDEILIPSALASMSLCPLDLDPGHYAYPTFHSYLTAAVIFTASKAGLFRLTSDKAFYVEHPVHMARLIVAGRLLCIAMGIATLWVNYATSRKLHLPWMGALAALSLGSSPLWIRDSTFMLVNTPLGFWGALVFFYSVTYIEKVRRGDRAVYALWLGAIAVGLAAGTKYPGLALAAVPIAAVLLGERIRQQPGSSGLAASLPRLIVVLAIIIVTVFVSSPYVFINWDQAVADTSKTSGSLRTFNIRSAGAFIAANGVPYSLILAIAVAAIFRRAARVEDVPSLLAIWCLATMFTPFASAFTYVRYWVPFLPAAAMCCGYICTLPHCKGMLGSRSILLGLACMPSAIVGASVLACMGLRDPLADVSAWVQANVPANATVAVSAVTTEMPVVDCRKYRVIALCEACPELVVAKPGDVFIATGPDLLHINRGMAPLKSIDYTCSPALLFPKSWSAPDWKYTSNGCAVYSLSSYIDELAGRADLRP